MEMPGFPHINLSGEQVLVLGGGDTAMDCVRTAIRQGAESVTCVYRRDRENMPGSQKEVDHAMKEGVKFEFNTLPAALQHSNNGTLQGLKISRTQLVRSQDGGRARPQVIEGSEELLPASAIIIAFGYRPSPPAWLETLTVNTADSGLVDISGLPGQTSNPAIFAAGDMVRGSDLVVTAIADARDAANGMLQYLEMQHAQLKRA
jgi:glutamate synthase (NADPH/NADH) small chain